MNKSKRLDILFDVHKNLSDKHDKAYQDCMNAGDDYEVKYKIQNRYYSAMCKCASEIAKIINRGKNE